MADREPKLVVAGHLFTLIDSFAHAIFFRVFTDGRKKAIRIDQRGNETKLSRSEAHAEIMWKVKSGKYRVGYETRVELTASGEVCNVFGEPFHACKF